MVESMKKLSVLMPSSQKEVFLERLQQLGVLHLEEKTLPEDPELETLKGRIQELQKIEQALTAHKNFPVPKELVSYEEAEIFCQAVRKALQGLTHLHVEKESLGKDLRALAPWGAFDPLLMEELEQRGLGFSFYTQSKSKHDLQAFGDVCVQVLGEQRGVVYLVILQEEGQEFLGGDGLFLQEEKIPRKNQNQLENELAVLQANIQNEESVLAGLYAQKGILDQEITLLKEQRDFLTARLSLNPEAGGQVMSLLGYVPRSRLASAQGFLEKQEALYLVESPEDPQNVPVKLKNPPLSRLFEPITRIFGLPRYGELDTTPFLAPFFALFFGLCLADFGYGVVVLLLSLGVFFKTKKPALKSTAVLGIVLGIMVLAGGIVFNTLFGTAILKIPGLPEAWRKFVLFDDLDAAMAFSLALGVFQVLFGYLLRMVNSLREGGIMKTLQPGGTFLIILGFVILGLGELGPGYTIGPLPAGYWASLTGDPFRAGLYLIVFGTALVLLFNNLHKKIWIRPLLGLWEMYGIASGIPGDILSYIRIFALSLAGGLLGGAINQIAFMIRGDDPNPLSYIFMLLILLGGHSFNFALAALGAFVHPLRLTFVEFYKAVGFAGGGKPYRPFKKRIALDGGIG